MSDDITCSIACRYRKYLYPLTISSIQKMCQHGVFKTAHKKGAGKKAHWWISGAEIVQWKINRHATALRDQ